MPQENSMQPLEMSDFSGGITENILQGDPRRYQSADNLYITIDKKLQERPAFVAFSSTGYNIPSAVGQRINNYFTVINESILLANSARNFYYQNTSGVWTKIVGVNGGEALTAGDTTSQVTISEFQRQVYVASDGVLGSNGVQPTKLYRDTTNTWVAKTAGLPRSYSPGNYSNSSLLSACIVNANALRTSIIAHLNDAQNVASGSWSNQVAPGVTPGFLHANLDVLTLCYFQTVAFPYSLIPAPSPLPTPQAACVDQASLFLLVQALNSAYAIHIADGMQGALTFVSQTGATASSFHQNFPFTGGSQPLPRGPGATLNSPGTPTTLTACAAMLDDLWQKWNFHRLGVFTHDQQNNYGILNRYAPVGAKIGTVFLTQGAPTITPDFSDIIRYANNLKFIHNAHVFALPAAMTSQGFVGAHKQTSNYLYNLGLQCTLPDATDLDSAYILIYWVRALYGSHYIDANALVYINVNYTSTAGSANLTAMSFVASGGTNMASLVGQYAWPIPVRSIVGANQDGTTTYSVSRVLTAGTGIATLDRPALNTATSIGQFSLSQYHQNINPLTGASIDGGSPEQSIDNLSNPYLTVGSSLATWLLLANDFFYAIANHISNQNIHFVGSSGTFFFNTMLKAAPYLNFFIPTVATVSYAVFFTDQYTVEQNGIQYLVNGNPVVSASTTVPISQPVGTVPTNLYPAIFTQLNTTVQYGTTLSNLPVLVNDATTQYDTVNAKLNIYRTTNGGTTFYLLAQLPNGTTTYLDIINDTVANPGGTPLISGQPIYTAGGVVGSDQPPVAKFTHILNGTVYWGGVTDTGQFFPNRIRQSVPFAPDNSPATFTDDLDDALVGLSSTHNNLIAFCQNSIYRMAGGFNIQGQGALTHSNISDTLGCMNAKSIVRTEVGIFFAGNDGFYYTDGFQIINITLELKKTYAALTQSASQKRSIYGAYDKVSRKVYWAMKTSANDSDNSVVYVFYLDYGIKPSGTFTLIQNGSNFRPSSLVFMQGVLYYAHEKGYLLKADPLNKFDSLVNSGTPDTWVNGAIPYNWTSVAVDMGTVYRRKYMTKFHLIGENIGNVGVQPNVIRDMGQYNNKPIAFTPINYTQNMRWNTPIVVWGDATQVWNQGSKMDVYRAFPQGSLRCDFMQMQLVPASLPVYVSSISFPFGANATVNSGAKSATIVTPSGYTKIVWPSDIVGYTICFQTDGYKTQYTIVSLNPDSTVLRVNDPNGTLPNATVPWQIMGVKKEQRIKITSMVIHYMYLGDKNQAYPGGTSASGPGNGGANPS